MVVWKSLPKFHCCVPYLLWIRVHIFNFFGLYFEPFQFCNFYSFFYSISSGDEDGFGARYGGRKVLLLGGCLSVNERGGWWGISWTIVGHGVGSQWGQFCWLMWRTWISADIFFSIKLRGNFGYEVVCFIWVVEAFPVDFWLSARGWVVGIFFSFLG